MNFLKSKFTNAVIPMYLISFYTLVYLKLLRSKCRKYK
jgi:hypothetical protein